MKIFFPITEQNKASLYFVFGLMISLLWAIIFRKSGDAVISDPDLMWHIRVGQEIWQTKSVPYTDNFSHSFLGMPWIAKEWLSQLIFYFAYSAYQWNGVVFLTTLIMAASGALIYRHFAEYLDPVKSSIASTFVLFAEGSTFVSRPFLLTLIPLVIWTHTLFKASENNRAPPYSSLLIIVFWANLHAGFTMAFLIALFAFFNYIEQREYKSSYENIKKWIKFLILCPLVTFIHPYIWKPILATFMVMSANEAVPLITEWQAFNPFYHIQYDIILAACLLIILLSGWRNKISKIALATTLTILFIIHLRFSFYTFTIIPMIFASDLSKRFKAWSQDDWRNRQSDAIEFTLKKFDKYIAGTLYISLISLGIYTLYGEKLSPPEKISAKSAIRHAIDTNISGNVFNHYDFGGALIFHNIKTFIDGRTDQLFLGGFADTYMSGPNNIDELKKMIIQYKINWAILPPLDPRLTLFKALPNFDQVYADKYAVIYLKVRDEF